MALALVVMLGVGIVGGGGGEVMVLIVPALVVSVVLGVVGVGAGGLGYATIFRGGDVVVLSVVVLLAW